MLRFTRGQRIDFATTFVDGDGNATNPTGATLHVAWHECGWERSTEIEMTDTGNGTWTASWDSRNADPGRIAWHVLTDDDATIAEDGMLLLDGNMANIGRERTDDGYEVL